MAKPFDAATKYLLEAHPEDWLRLAGITPTKAEPIAADLATVTADADTVLRVGAPAPWLVHMEMQASYDRALRERTLQYNALLHRRHHLAVQSVIILLRPAADGPAMTGNLALDLPNGARYLSFDYTVVRLWQQPAEALLNGGLGTLPLAPLAASAEADLPGIVHRMEERIGRESPPGQAGTLWTAANVLMGLRYPHTLVDQLLKGVRAMKESVTYQAIVEEGFERGFEHGIERGIERGIQRGIERGIERGAAEGAREVLLRVGTRRFGPPSGAIQDALQSITAAERLESLADRVLDVETWDDLLAEGHP